MANGHPPAMTATENTRRSNISRKMKENAEQDKCPECGRKAAIKRHIISEERLAIRTCRWCDYEVGIDLDTGKQTS